MMVEFPFRLRHYANTTGYWRAKAGHTKQLRELVGWHLNLMGARPELPCKVVMTRGAPRLFDDDNVVHAFKCVRDEIASWIGVDDRYTDQVSYSCKQERTKGERYFVRIEFMPGNTP